MATGDRVSGEGQKRVIPNDPHNPPAYSMWLFMNLSFVTVNGGTNLAYPGPGGHQEQIPFMALRPMGTGQNWLDIYPVSYMPCWTNPGIHRLRGAKAAYTTNSEK